MTSDADIDLDVVVVNYKTYRLLDDFVKSYWQYRTENLKTTLTIVDVESMYDAAPIRELITTDIPSKVVTTRDNCGYARACNKAATYRSGRNIAFFNADTRFVNDTCLLRCSQFLDDNPQVGIVGPLQRASDGVVTHAGIFGTIDQPKDVGFHRQLEGSFLEDKEAVSVSGSAFFVKRSVWDELTACPLYEPFDAEGAFLPTKHYFEETACAVHAQAHGYKVWYLGSAEMIHEWHRSTPVGSMVPQVKESKALYEEFRCAHNI